MNQTKRKGKTVTLQRHIRHCVSCDFCIDHKDHCFKEFEKLHPSLPQTKPAWEEEFNTDMQWESPQLEPGRTKWKKFIHSLLSSERKQWEKEMVERLEKKQQDADKTNPQEKLTFTDAIEAVGERK